MSQIEISIDKDRRINIKDKNYEDFESILNQIEIPDLENEPFPRAPKQDPIPSYGVILVYDDGDNFEYFCTQSRTTIEFAEFIKCGPRKEYLYEYFSLMTDHERQTLLEHNHKKLWNALLIEEAEKYDHVRKRTKVIFNHFAPYFKQLLDLTFSQVHEPPWVFPKGRNSNNDRTLLQTALRELEEEAQIKVENFELLIPIPMTEVFLGTDGVAYSSFYYVIKVPTRFEPFPIHINNVLGETGLSQDMKDYCWIPVSKSKPGSSIINSPLKDRLQSILIKVHDIIRN